MKSNIFPMNRADLGPVGALSDQLGYPVNLSELAKRFEELTSLPNHQLLVINDQGVKGWIHLEIVYDLIEEKKIEIKALVVDEKERRKGYGRQLVEAAREWAKTNLISTIYLSCNIIRDRAHSFYLREGFSKTKTSHFFELKI